MANDTFGRELLIGDRVLFTARHHIYCGIIAKINTYKATIRKTNENFEFKFGYDTTIDFNKIYKFTGHELVY